MTLPMLCVWLRLLFGVLTFVWRLDCCCVGVLQAARANATQLVQAALAFTGSDLVQYLKIAAVKAHGAVPGQATVLGLGDPFPT